MEFGIMAVIQHFDVLKMQNVQKNTQFGVKRKKNVVIFIAMQSDEKFPQIIRNLSACGKNCSKRFKLYINIYSHSHISDVLTPLTHTKMTQE